MDAADIATDYLESAMDRADAQRKLRCQEAQRQAAASGGWCSRCHERIPAARLAAVDTDLCIDCAQFKEQERKR